jgi:hypothetical protein
MIDGGFNDLEKAVLLWVIDYYKDPKLTAQIQTAKLVHREWTKVGFWVQLKVSKDVASINDADGLPIDGPLIHSNDIDYAAIALLWSNDGYINEIEMAAYGDFFNENVSDFTLSEFKPAN